MYKENPFSVNRAEFMSNLWKYYVPFSQLNFDTPKSLVIEGGRGTGKTMFFLCNSWREKIAQFSENQVAATEKLINGGNIGLYYKVDPSFVGAMRGEERECHWNGIFNTYLSIEIARELFALLEVAYKSNFINVEDVKKLSTVYYQSVRSRKRTATDFLELIQDCESVLNEIEDVINDPTLDIDKFRLTTPGTIINNLIVTLLTFHNFRNVIFRVFIDEYESLTDWQQRIINTLIKKSSNKLIYNVGMKPKGMKTPDTIASNEIIQDTHDYMHFTFDTLLNGEDYKNVLKNICKRRLEIFSGEFFAEQITIPTDIEFYLGNYNIDHELERLNNRKKPRFYDYLCELIKQNTLKKDDLNKYLEALCDNAPPLNARLHLALLLRAKNYKPSIEDLYFCYTDWKNGNDTRNRKKYEEWIHNTKNGLIFLLDKDYNLPKWYYGFDTYVSLSSGVVRYFLELCEQTFNTAIMYGFDWANPRQISSETQTRAAKYVARNKVMEIERYPQHGRSIRLFVQCLGEIFRNLHRDDRLTLGEPEPNHFSTNSLGMELQEKEILNCAVLWMVLQELPQTKGKDSIKTNIVDYHLNKIYAPHFEISYNKNRKIEFSNEAVKDLLSGNVKIAESSTKRFLSNYWKQKEKLPVFLEGLINEVENEQLNLFRLVDGGYDL